MKTQKIAIVLLSFLLTPLICAAAAQSNNAVELGDVLMRSLRAWSKDENDERNTLEAAKAFKVDKILWIYENTPEFNDKVRAAGIGIGTTMADNAREIWLNKLSSKQAEDFVAKYTVRNLKGEQVIPEHFKPFTDPYTIHFVPDMTIPEWSDIYAKYLIGLYDKGIDTIHRDDPTSTLWSMRYGGTFTGSAVEYFRKYLQENYNAEQLKSLGVDDIATFNVRKHFLALGAPTDNMFWQWRGSPLMKPFADALMKANTDFYIKVRAKVEQATGRKIPWSLNGTGPYNDVDRFFDFRIGEYQLHHNQPQTLLVMSGYAVREGKMQALISMVDGKWNEHPEEFVQGTRRHIATAYAVGMIPLVPYCMYMHKAPRYYGTVEDFGDLFHFVSENRSLFDGHSLVEACGIDTMANLYSWLPNKEMQFRENGEGKNFRISSENVFSFFRENKATGSKVVHLVDWNESPQAFELAFNPSDIAGTDAVNIVLMQHGKDDVKINGYAGGMIEIPAITPWALLTIEPAKSSAAVVAPKIISPARRVVPGGSQVVLGAADNRSFFWRFGGEGEFKKYDKQHAPVITDSCVFETYAIENNGKKSAVLSAAFDVYDNYSVDEKVIASAMPVKRLENSFTSVRGEMKVNASFLGGKLFMDGKEMKNAVSTKGNALISCQVDPSWEYFTVEVGLDDAEDRRPCARFQVWFDSNMAYETAILNPSKLILDDGERVVFPISLQIPKGVSQIRLVSVPSGFFADHNHIVWNEPTAYSRGSSIEHGDVLMRSLRVWPKDEDDDRNTLEAAKAFKVDKIVWIYQNDKEYNQKVVNEGIGIGTTMESNARDHWLPKMTKDQQQKFVDKFTIRNIKGEQVMLRHMTLFSGNPYITHFQPDINISGWVELYTNYVSSLYTQGIETIHRDDPSANWAALRAGGTFTDASVEYFRNYLKENFTAEQLKDLGVDDVSVFNVREHFLALDAPTDSSLWQWTGSPLLSIYSDAMLEATIKFYQKVRASVEERTGIKVPWSRNGVGPLTALDEVFDFRIGEYQRHHSQPQTLLTMARYSTDVGRIQATISMVDGNWNEHHEEYVRETRKHIPTAYAVGMIPLVPWCMYMHQAPRYYGTVEEFGDLYHLVSANRQLFDGHKLVAANGIDTQANLYSWQPNKELVYPDNSERNLFWLSEENIFAFLREDKNTGSKVVHLVDWDTPSKDFTLSFSPSDITGTLSADVRILRHGRDNIIINGYAGGKIDIDALSPWALMTIKPSASQEKTAAPRILSPTRKVVSIGTKIVLDSLQQNSTIYWRFKGDGDFRQYNQAALPVIRAGGAFEAYSVRNSDGQKSEVVEAHYDVYNDYSVDYAVVAGARKAKELENSFRCIRGEMKVNTSFLADNMLLMGEKISRGISTQDNALLVCNVEPSWRYFTVRVGVDDAEDRRPSARFQVLFDNDIAYETPIINPSKLIIVNEERRVYEIAVRIPKGISQIRLVSMPGGFFHNQNNIIWAEPTAY